MIEAVNSVLSNTSATRVAAEQQSTVRSFAANPERTQEIARAPFISPFISIDRNSNRVLLQIRDSDTGDVVRQFPTEGQLRAYRTAQEFSDRQAAREAQGEIAAPSSPVTPQVSSSDSSVEVADVPQPSVGTVETEA